MISAATKHSAPVDKSACGSTGQTCHSCRKAERDTRVSVSNGLRLIRIRFGLPFSELPDLEVKDLDRYLLFLLLQGTERPACPFPRRQKPSRASADGITPLERLWKRERWEFAHSVSSLKRNLPAGCGFHKPSKRSEWSSNACKSPPPLPDGYLRFVRKEVRRLFPFRWDCQYESCVDRFVPKASSRYEKSTRADLALASAGGGKEFRRNTLAGRGFDTAPLRARYKEVLSAGKVRPLVIFDRRVDLLGPLHTTIYDHLSRFPWLLRGPPTEARVSSTLVHEFQTSVDLVSATDNLSLEVATTILECLLSKASRVPGAVRLLAVNSLTPIVDWEGGTLEVTHGQMMGGYLSFPLLCLQSYLAARWATRRQDAEILVNGDDVLISSARPVVASDYPSGFQMNEKKTIRSKVVAEINSTCYLLDGKGKWRQVQHLRRGSFLPDFPGLLHAAAAVRSVVKWTDAFIRSRIGKGWGLTPRQLDLHPLSYPAWQRTRELRRTRWDTELPCRKAETQELRVLPGDPDPEAVFALCEHLRCNGRGSVALRDVYSPSKGCVRRTFSYRSKEPRWWLSWDAYRRSLRLARKEKPRTYYVPAYYETREEQEGMRGLELLLKECRSPADP